MAISRVLRENMVESVPLLAWHLPEEGQAGLLTCGPNLRTDWQLSSCRADWRVANAAQDHCFHGLATLAPWMVGPVPAKSFVSHASYVQLQEAIPQSRRSRMPPSLLALRTHAGTQPALVHASTSP